MSKAFALVLVAIAGCNEPVSRQQAMPETRGAADANSTRITPTDPTALERKTPLGELVDTEGAVTFADLVRDAGGHGRSRPQGPRPGQTAPEIKMGVDTARSRTAQAVRAAVARCIGRHQELWRGLGASSVEAELRGKEAPPSIAFVPRQDPQHPMTTGPLVDCIVDELAGKVEYEGKLVLPMMHATVGEADG